ncbi:MAG TPA: hypothetical protein VK933_05440, partial [Longimicrobiales bacterium]|nr:hypothetical protein [Longimicrobiales bacterium]
MPDIRSPRALMLAVLTSVFLSVGCERGDAPSGDAERPAGDPAVAPAPADMPLVPAEAAFDQVNALVKDPARDPLP